jgi:peptide/nickel transport system substrate-binding protein
MARRISLCALAFILFASCGGRERPVAVQRPVDPSIPRDGGTINRHLEIDINTLNPILATTRDERLVANYLFTPLVRIDAALNPVPGIAQSWTISEDGRVYTFKLNPKATFSDGTPVRAADVLFSLNKVVDPANEAVQISSYFELYDPQQTKVIDDGTIAIAFKEPLAAQLVLFNNLVILSERIYSKGDFKTAFNSTAMGSGPYRFVSRKVGSEIVLERRKDYWDRRPYIQTVVFKVITNATTAWNAVKRGDLDETTIASDLWLHGRSDPSLRDRLDFRRFYTRSYNVIAWNGRDPLFADRRVRHALAGCVNLPILISQLYYGTARALNSPFMPDDWAYNPAVPVIPYDPQASRRALASIGWLDTNGDGVLDHDGKPFHFKFLVMSGSNTGMTFAQILQNDLKAIGVKMEIEVLDGSKAISNLRAGDYQAGYLAWEADSPDPDPFQLLHSTQIPPQGQNFVFYANPEADRLIDEGRREVDQKKRVPIYHQLHEVLAADQPFTWTVQPSLKCAINKRVHGVKESNGMGLFTWYPGEFDWWVSN